jgi:hypothetical protein
MGKYLCVPFMPGALFMFFILAGDSVKANTLLVKECAIVGEFGILVSL